MSTESLLEVEFTRLTSSLLKEQEKRVELSNDKRRKKTYRVRYDFLCLCIFLLQFLIYFCTQRFFCVMYRNLSIFAKKMLLCKPDQEEEAEQVQRNLRANSDLEQGKILPEYLQGDVNKADLFQPLVDPDPYYYDKNVCVLQLLHLNNFIKLSFFVFADLHYFEQKLFNLSFQRKQSVVLFRSTWPLQEIGRCYSCSCISFVILLCFISSQTSEEVQMIGFLVCYFNFRSKVFIILS